MKIVNFETEPREAFDFEELKNGNDLTYTEYPLQIDNAGKYADAEIVSTFIYSRLNRDVLARLPKLKLIATRSTGYDPIDMAWCSEHDIKVANVPIYGENTVAEHVFALLLTISHRLREAMERARSGRFSPQGLEGSDLQGKTIGAIGTGNIGRHVVRIARGFGMKVVAFEVRPDSALAADAQVRYANMDELLATSDVITLHVSALPQTEHLLDADVFARTKRGVVVINTARGHVIDSRALVDALRSGKVAAAGLDVLPDEPLIREEAELICSIFCNQQDVRNWVADYVLLNMPNVIITPHSAFNTREAVHRIVLTTVANIQAFLDCAPQNLVAGKIQAGQ